MVKNKKTWFIVAISILLFSSGTIAESLSPTEFRIALKGSDGRFLEKTNMPVEFRVFDSAEGGTLLWEVQLETTDGKGEDFFIAQAPLAGEALAMKAADASADRLWLEIEVGGDTLYPRQLLERLPATFQGYGPIYEAEIRVVSERAADPAALNLDANAVEAGKNISMGGNWLSGDGADEGVFMADSGYVGIGDDTPSSMLDVAGTATADGGNSTEWNTAYDWGNHASQGYLTAESDPQVGANTTGYVPKWNGSALVTGGIHDNNGNVGIGTTNATERLVLNNASGSAVLRISAAADYNASVDS